MSKGLTARQREVLEAFASMQRERAIRHRYANWASRLGISSLRGVTIHLDALARKGFIERQSTSRSIRLLTVPRTRRQSRFGAAARLDCGRAADAGGRKRRVYVPIPPEMAAGEAELFALRVKGDSMIGDAISTGHYHNPQPAFGRKRRDIAALIGDEARSSDSTNRVSPARLLPSNPSYQPIELAREDVRILGKSGRPAAIIWGKLDSHEIQNTEIRAYQTHHQLVSSKRLHGLRGSDGVFQVVIGGKYRIQARDLQDSVDGCVALHEVDRAALGPEPPGRGKQRAKTAAVHIGHFAHVDDQVLLAAGDYAVDGLLELRGGIDVDFPRDIKDVIPSICLSPVSKRMPSNSASSRIRSSSI